MINTLYQLLESPAEIRADDHILAYSDGEAVTWVQFRARVNDWEQTLISIAEHGVALYERNSLEFLAALIALWRLEKQVLVPANNLPFTCQQLQGFTTAFVGDFPLDGVITCSKNRAVPIALKARGLAKKSTVPALTLFTSGSTGNPEPVEKNFDQLDAELLALENQWGSQVSSAVITSSVSHQHIYGLLFRLLWPFCAGRPFIANERDYWEELAEDTKLYGRTVIVSSPAHLTRIPALTWAGAPALVFSSGAPLATEAALSAHQQLQCPLFEVYGSTETGGIAWRNQAVSSMWACLPGVSVRCENADGLLEIKSRHLQEEDWFISADRASMYASGSFILCGRADRIVKVAGKRISLTAIERTLEQHPWVQQARVLVLPDRAERLGAALVLTNEGNRHLVDQGKNALNESIKAALAHAVDRIAIPRYWRYLADMPRNRQGKTTQLELQQLFSQESSPRFPEIIGSRQDNLLSLSLTFFIPSNLYYFNGHFPGRPVLPGVVQTHWAVHYAREHWGLSGEFSGLEALKFQQVVTANQVLELQMKYDPGTDTQTSKLYFNYTSSQGINKQVAHSSGRIIFTRGAV